MAGAYGTVASPSSALGEDEHDDTRERRRPGPTCQAVAPHLRKRRDKATAWSPTRAATAAGCSRTCRLLLPGDVEGWRGPQNRVAAQLPERRRARRRRPPNKPFRRRPRRPRGPSAWPRPSSVGRTRSPCV